MKVPITGKKVLVTGAAGVIGRELVGRLDSIGAEVLCLDRAPLEGAFSERVRSLRIDLALEDLSSIQGFDPQVILHLAASFERSRESKGFWEVNWRDNVLASHRLAGLARKLQELETFVFASSYLVYSPSLYLSGSPGEDVRPLKEGDLKEPRNICGGAKLYTERELGYLKEVHRPSIRIAFARICRAFGKGSQDVISRWVHKALGGETIEVYNKENRFDFIFAGDVAEGLVRLVEEEDARGPFNLGSGTPRSIEDVLNTLRRILHREKIQIVDHGRKEDFEASCVDMSRIKELTGWEPATSLEQGIGMIVEFAREARR